MLSRLTIGAKLLLMTAASVLALAGLALAILPAARYHAVEQEVGKVRAITETARGVALALDERVKAGELTLDAAKAEFARIIHAMRYENGVEYLFVFDMDGVTVVHPQQPALEGRNLWDLQDPNGLYLIRELAGAARAGGGAVHYMWPMTQGADPVPKVSYVYAIEPWNLFIGTGVYLSQVDAIFGQLVIEAAAVTAVAILLAALAGWVIARSITRPADEVAAFVTRLARGESIDRALHTERRDAIGAIARAVDHLRQVIADRDRLAAAQGAAEEARKAELARAMLAMADSLEAEVAGEVEAMQSDVHGVATHTGNLRTLAETMRTTALATFAAVDEGNTGVQTVATATEELTASSNEIGRQVEVTARVSRDAVTAAEGASRSVERVAASSRTITDVVRLINDIAEQTNLLALNATIEAARAGDAGRGFTVVAQEVKSLADQTAKATGDIEAQVRAMQSDADRAVDAIGGIVGTVGRVSETTNAMAAAIEEQHAAIREIAGTLQRVAQSSARIRQNMEEMRRGVDHTGSAVAVVADASTALKGRSSSVRGVVGAFLGNLRTTAAARTG